MIEPGGADGSIPHGVSDFTVYDANGTRFDLHMELKEGTAVVLMEDDVDRAHGWGPCKHHKKVHFLRVKAKP